MSQTISPSTARIYGLKKVCQAWDVSRSTYYYRQKRKFTAKRGPKPKVENAYRHWEAHRHEFPSLQNSKQYVEATRDFVQNSPKGTLTKIRSNGDTVHYNPASITFAITNQHGVPRTMYRPSPSTHHYQTNLDYYYAQ